MRLFVVLLRIISVAALLANQALERGNARSNLWVLLRFFVPGPAMGVFRGGGAPPPNRPKKLSLYHDEGSTGGTSLAAMPSVLDTKARRLNFVQ